MHQNMSLGPNGVSRVCSLWKIMTRLCGTNFCTSSARFALCFVRQPNGSKIHPNSIKHTKSCVWSPMGWIGCIRCEKIPTRLRGTNFCTSLAHFALSVVTQPNYPKCTQIVQTHRNMRLGSNRVDRVVHCEKFRHDFVARTFAPLRLVLHQVLYGNQTVPNAPK